MLLSPLMEDPKHGPMPSEDDNNRSLSSFSSPRKQRGAIRQLDSASLLELEASTDFGSLVRCERFQEWARSVHRLDPRLQIATFFDDVARDGGIVRQDSSGGGRSSSAVRNPELQSPLLRNFARSSVFTVWRPTSVDAIRAIVTGAATGKGLDVKGKSARGGRLSGYVPFLQIHEEGHKRSVRTAAPDARVRAFYGSEEAREEARGHLDRFRGASAAAAADNGGGSGAGGRDDAAAAAAVAAVDAYAGAGRWGIECPLSLFWDATVVPADISRPPGSDLDGGRPSEPAFMDMNLETVRKGAAKAASVDGGGPCPVLWQSSPSDPLDPRTLLIAYEEGGRVLPVVSDFDCFTVGTRGVRYDRQLAPEQVDLVRWSVSSVESILEERHSKKKDGGGGEASWCKVWLEVLKHAALEEEDGEEEEDDNDDDERKKREEAATGGGGRRRKPDVPLPPFGFGDPTSYGIVEHAVRRLTCGAVRHGAECFNYTFPQDLDDHFLVVSDTLPGNVPWKYVSEPELRELLLAKIDEGFSFPVNPKWVMCDPGWKDVYDRLVSSECRNVRRSVDVWFPPGSGLRERIEGVCARFPEGFDGVSGAGVDDGDDGDDGCTGAMDLAELELKRYRMLLRAKRKLRTCLTVRNLGKVAPPDDEDN